MNCHWNNIQTYSTANKHTQIVIEKILTVNKTRLAIKYQKEITK